MEQIVGSVKDPNLKLTLAFGIGMHHAGLQERDRKTVEELFVNQKIQVIIISLGLLTFFRLDFYYMGFVTCKKCHADWNLNAELQTYFFVYSYIK